MVVVVVVPHCHQVRWVAGEEPRHPPPVWIRCRVGRSCTPSGLIYRSTVGLLCCFLKPCDAPPPAWATLEAIVKEGIFFPTIFREHALSGPPPSGPSAPPDSQHSAGGSRHHGRVGGGVIWNTFSFFVAVKSGRHVPKPPAPHGAPHRGAAARVGRLWGESGSLSAAIGTRRREHSCGSSCTVYNPPPHVFTERWAVSGGVTPLGGLGWEVKAVIT